MKRFAEGRGSTVVTKGQWQREAKGRAHAACVMTIASQEAGGPPNPHTQSITDREIPMSRSSLAVALATLTLAHSSWVAQPPRSPWRRCMRSSAAHPVACVPQQQQEQPPDDVLCDTEASYCETAAGLKYLDVKVGEGELAVPSLVVSVHYDCSLLSTGKVVYSTRDSGSPATFEVGAEKVRFLEEATEGMRVGGERRVLVPPGSKMKASKAGVVPDGETARFDIQLLGVETGIKEKLVKAGLLGAGSQGGFRLRLAIIALTSLPYLLPDEQRPGLWRSGSPDGLLPNRDDGGIRELPALTERESRALVEEERSVLGFNDAMESKLEDELYGRR